MAYFSAGVLLGLVASYFLFYRLRSGRGFSQLLQKEINLNGYLLQIEQAGQRMDHLEERCCRLERKLSGTARAKNFSKSDLSGRIGPGRKPEQVLELWEGG
ncbi:MAG: hypothetical protein GX878_10620, partial [Firmicutes bacterium]|nr:hypothetical protein [Bacillota bacterium]